MSQPPYPYFPQQQYPQQQQYLPQQFPHQSFPTPQFQQQQHWFAQMCEAVNRQKSIHEASSDSRPLVLTPGNYVQ